LSRWKITENFYQLLCILVLESLNIFTINFIREKSYLFALKVFSKCFHSVGDKLAEIYISIDLESFHLIFASMHLDKTVFLGKT
jgi:hypothetical protein